VKGVHLASHLSPEQPLFILAAVVLSRCKISGRGVIAVAGWSSAAERNQVQGCAQTAQHVSPGNCKTSLANAARRRDLQQTHTRTGQTQAGMERLHAQHAQRRASSRTVDGFHLQPNPFAAQSLVHRNQFTTCVAALHPIPKRPSTAASRLRHDSSPVLLLKSLGTGGYGRSHRAPCQDGPLAAKAVSS
jgi:hypothetical protein